MKIAQHFRAFLEEHNYLLIPGIGRFEVIIEMVDPSTSRAYSRKLLQFMYSKEIISDDPLFIEYVSKGSRIESRVAHSDLEYFTCSTREVLMQGLEAEIPGIGFLNLGAGNKMVFSNRSRYYTATAKTKKLKPASVGMSFWF